MSAMKKNSIRGDEDATLSRMVREGLSEEVTFELGKELPRRGRARTLALNLAYWKNSQKSTVQPKCHRQEGEQEKVR